MKQSISLFFKRVALILGFSFLGSTSTLAHDCTVSFLNFDTSPKKIRSLLESKHYIIDNENPRYRIQSANYTGPHGEETKIINVFERGMSDRTHFVEEQISLTAALLGAHKRIEKRFIQSLPDCEPNFPVVETCKIKLPKDLSPSIREAMEERLMAKGYITSDTGTYRLSTKTNIDHRGRQYVIGGYSVMIYDPELKTLSMGAANWKPLRSQNRAILKAFERAFETLIECPKK